MEHLFTINAEGGPLLLCSLAVARDWRGADNAKDYESLCGAFDADPSAQGLITKIGNAPALAWEMAGAGVADVFRDETGKIVIVRAWLEEDSAEIIGQLAEAPVMHPISLGRLPVMGNGIAIMWAAESGETLPLNLKNAFECVEVGTAIEGSVYGVRVEANAFECRHDEIALPGGQARRLTLGPVQA